MGRVLFLLPWISLLFQVTSGKGQVTLQLIKYANPTGKDATGGCCEGVFNCKDLCDPFFKVCYIEMPNTARKCLTDTGHYENTNSIHFGQTIGGSTKNPLTFSFDHFRTGLRLEIDALDHDTGIFFGSHDDIETVRHDVAGALAFNSTQSGTTVTMKGSRVNLEVKIRVKCDIYYYDDGCGTYCRAEDNPDHYVCSNTGIKICLRHWIGSNCNIWDHCFNNRCRNGATCINKPTILKNSNDYTCNCLKGYTGKFCETSITTTPKSTTSTSTTSTTTTATTTATTTTTRTTTTSTTTTPTTITTISTTKTTTALPPTTATFTTTTTTTTTTPTTITTATSTATTTSSTTPSTTTTIMATATASSPKTTLTSLQTSVLTKAVTRGLPVTTRTTTLSSPTPVPRQSTTEDKSLPDMTLPIILGTGGLVALTSCLLMTFILRRRCKRKVNPKQHGEKNVRTKARYNVRRPRR